MRKRILRNTLLLSGSQILGRVIGFLYFIFLARALSVETFGTYAWVLGFIYNFYPLADFGLERLVMREVARNPKMAKFYLDRLLPLRFILAVVSLSFCLLLALVLQVRGWKLWYIFLFGLTLIPSNLVFIFAFIKNALEKMEEYAEVTVIIPILATALGIFFVYTKAPLFFLYITFFIATGIVFLWLFWKNKSGDLRMGWVVDISFWKRLLSQSWIFGIILTLAVFYIRTPLILTGVLLGDYWSGIYGAASRFVEAGILIPSSFALALFPLSSRLVLQDRQLMRRVYVKAVFLLFLTSLPVFLVMFFGARFIIPLIYGERYFDAIPVFSLMGVLMIFYFVNSVAGNVIQNSEKLKMFLPFAFLNFLVAVVAGLILIPKMGVIGGVWAAILGEIFGLIVNNVFVFKILND